MRINRRMVAMLVLLVGTICAYVGVHGQSPAPPPPIVPPPASAEDSLPFDEHEPTVPGQTSFASDKAKRRAPPQAWPANANKPKAPWLLPNTLPPAPKKVEASKVTPVQYIGAPPGQWTPAAQPPAAPKTIAPPPKIEPKQTVPAAQLPAPAVQPPTLAPVPPAGPEMAPTGTLPRIVTEQSPASTNPAPGSERLVPVPLPESHPAVASAKGAVDTPDGQSGAPLPETKPEIYYPPGATKLIPVIMSHGSPAQIVAPGDLQKLAETKDGTPPPVEPRKAPEVAPAPPVAPVPRPSDAPPAVPSATMVPATAPVAAPPQPVIAPPTLAPVAPVAAIPQPPIAPPLIPSVDIPPAPASIEVTPQPAVAPSVAPAAPSAPRLPGPMEPAPNLPTAPSAAPNLVIPPGPETVEIVPEPKVPFIPPGPPPVSVPSAPDPFGLPAARSSDPVVAPPPMSESSNISIISPGMENKPATPPAPKAEPQPPTPITIVQGSTTAIAPSVTVQPPTGLLAADNPPATGKAGPLVVPNPEPKRLRPLRLYQPRGADAPYPLVVVPTAKGAVSPMPPPSIMLPTASQLRETAYQPTPVPPAAPIALPPLQPAGALSPTVMFEKSGPTTMNPGQMLTFEIVLKNTGAMPATQIHLEDDIPPGALILRAHPMPLMQKGKLVWAIDSLAAGAEQRIKIDMKATQPGSCMSQLLLTVAALPNPPAMPQNVPTQTAGLNVSVQAPESAQIGQPVLFEIQVVNNGPLPLREVMLHADLSDGLKHKEGRHIEGVMKELPPGAVKTIKLEAFAAQPGRHGIYCFAKAAGAARVSAQATVRIGPDGAQRLALPNVPPTVLPDPPSISQASLQVQQNAQGLQVQQNPTYRLLPGQPNEVRIWVVNNSPRPMRHVAITDALPEDVTFKGASDKGTFHWSTRTVQWLVDLAPGQSKALSMQLQPQKSGQWSHDVQAKLGGAPEVRSLGLLVAEGFPNLSVRIFGRDAHIDVGKETVYEVRVVNHGNAPATNVELAVTLSDGLAPGYIQGASKHQTSGKRITFAPLPKLDPHAEAIFHVGAVGMSPGDRRVHVQVTSDQSPTPVTREERTEVYKY